jgi:hypothetical protein
MNGVIVNYDQRSGTGIIQTADGKMFPFGKADWRPSLLPRRNDKVEFAEKNGKAAEVNFPLGQEPAGANLRRAAASFDAGLIAGAYAIMFFAAAIANAFFNLIEIDANDIVGLTVILVLLTLASWIWGSGYKIMRLIASIFAGSVTVLAAIILIRHFMHGGS